MTAESPVKIWSLRQDYIDATCNNGISMSATSAASEGNRKSIAGFRDTRMKQATSLKSKDRYILEDPKIIDYPYFRYLYSIVFFMQNNCGKLILYIAFLYFSQVWVK